MVTKYPFLLPILPRLLGLAILLAIFGSGGVASAQYTATALPEGFAASCINNHDEIFGTLDGHAAVCFRVRPS